MHNFKNWNIGKIFLEYNIGTFQVVDFHNVFKALYTTASYKWIIAASRLTLAYEMWTHRDVKTHYASHIIFLLSYKTKAQGSALVKSINYHGTPILFDSLLNLTCFEKYDLVVHQETGNTTLAW